MRHPLTSVLVLGSLVAGVSSACHREPGEPLAAGHAPVVYGDDDRQDIYAYSDQTWATRVAEVTAALVAAGDVNDADPGNVQLSGETLQAVLGVCPDERFADQITPARCSGTLIAPDLVLTAGQCVRDAAECAATRVVFNFYMSAPGTLATVTSNDVYDCTAIVAQRFTGSFDYAVLRLDRPVTGRTPATVRLDTTAVAAGTPLTVHGTPSGLPIKIDDGGIVRDGRDLSVDYFVANLDTFSGSAGSGVFDGQSRELLGVVARGEPDYVFDGTCMRVHACPDGACAGEDVTYAFHAIAELCGDGTCDDAFAESTMTCVADCGSLCGDGVCNGAESALDCVADCGTCGNALCDAGETLGNCRQDCIAMCPNGTCEPVIGENPSSCASDCGQFCGNGTCESAYGETIVNCADDCADQCGNGMCEAVFGETVPNCPADCASQCGNNMCEDVYAETTANCPADCGTLCGDGACNGGETLMTCLSDCGSCGNDICEDGQDGREDKGENTDNCCDDCGCAAPDLFACESNECAALGDTCEAPAILRISQSTDPTSGIELIPVTGSREIAGETFLANADHSGTCTTGESPDRVYRLTVSFTTQIDIMARGGYDMSLILRRACDDDSAGNEIACNEDTVFPDDGGHGARVVAELAAGTYHLVVGGYNGDSGAYTLSVSHVTECDDEDSDGYCDDAAVCADDTDTDGDGTPDCLDGCDSDATKLAPGECGCGTPEGECGGCNCAVGQTRPWNDAAGGCLLALIGLAALRRSRRRRRS